MRRCFVLVSFIVVLMVLVGCSGNDPVEQVSYEEKITNQMNEWNKAWLYKDTSFFEDTMVAENINFSYYWGEQWKQFESTLTIKEFIELITNSEHWELWHPESKNCSVNIISITITDSSAILTGVWILNIPAHGGYQEQNCQTDITVQFIKTGNNEWLIKSISLDKWEIL